MRNYFELLGQFISTDFKLRYKNSYLGILWIILKPLASFAVIYIIWTNLFPQSPDFKMSLLLGIMIMNLFSESIMMGMTSLSTKAGIILKVRFPREVSVFSAVTISLFDFAINMIIFTAFAIWNPIDISFIGIILFILSIFSIYFITTGISLFLSIMFIRLRDLNNLVSVVLQLFFWMTPVYYKIEMLPENLQKIISLNPMTHIVTLARRGLLGASNIATDDFWQIGIVFVLSLIVFGIGVLFFKKRVYKIAEYF